MQILLNVTKSVENVAQEFPASTIIQENSDTFKGFLGGSITEIYQSSSRLNHLIDNSLKQLEIMQKRHEDKLKIRVISQLETLEIIGKLTGNKLQIIQLIKETKFDILDELELSWNKKFDRIQKRWFTNNKDGTQKTSIGWGDKEGFLKDITTEKDLTIRQLRQEIEQEIKLFFESLELLTLVRENLNDKFQLLNQADKTRFSGILNESLDEISNYFIPEFIIEFDKKMFGDLTVSDVSKMSDIMIKSLRIKIVNTFDQLAKIINNCFEKAIAFYNYFLEKQILYQQESTEQLTAEKQWIEHQIEQLQEIKKSLDYITEILHLV